MTPVRTRLRLDPLDARDLPAVTFAEASVAAGYLDVARGPIVDLTGRLGQTEPKRHAAEIATVFPAITQNVVNAERTLTIFLSELQATIVANPGNDDLVALAGHTWKYIELARLEFQYANTIGVLYGGSAFEDDTNPNLRTTIPNLNAPGWVTQPNGLRIRDRIVGEGPSVVAGSTVTVEYIGWLKTPSNRFGEVFDSSAEHGGTAQFSLTQVIAGWQQGVPGMRPGGIRQLDVPAALAYGAAGFPPDVPPNADLVFEIKMISSP